MFTSCCIYDCPSRSDKSVDERNRSTLCTRLFAFPVKNSENYKKWMDAVQCHLKKGIRNGDNLYICEHHFNESSFPKEGTKIWKDGKKVILPRKRLRLIKNAVPSVFTVVKSSAKSLQMSSVQSAPPIENKMAVLNESRLEANVEKSSIPLRQSSPVSLTVNKNSSNVSAGSSINVSAEKLPGIYCASDLIRDWNCKPANSLLEKWKVVFLPASRLLFAYFGDLTHNQLSVTRSVIIESDMSTKLQARGRHANFPILEKITCFKDITSILLKVVCLRLCQNVLCKDGLFQPKPHSSNVRCKSCKIRKRKHEQGSVHAKHVSTAVVPSAVKCSECAKSVKISSVQSTPLTENIEKSSIPQPQSSPVSLDMDDSSSNVSAGSLINVSAEKLSSIYSLSDLIRDWNCKPANSPLEKWKVVLLPASKLLFAYCGDLTHVQLNVTRTVIIESNMSTKLQARGRPASFPILGKITCFEDITTTLLKVVCLRLCENESCKDGFFQPKVHSSNVRCKSCQLKKRKGEQERARAKRFLARKAENRHCIGKVTRVTSSVLDQLIVFPTLTDDRMTIC